MPGLTRRIIHSSRFKACKGKLPKLKVGAWTNFSQHSTAVSAPKITTAHMGTWQHGEPATYRQGQALGMVTTGSAAPFQAELWPQL